MKTRLMTVRCTRSSLENLNAYFDHLRIQSCYIQTAAKRIIFFLLIAQFIASGTQAQTSHSRKKEDFDIKEFDEEIISIAPQSYILQLKHLQGITVIDARADTTDIGFMQKKVIDPLSAAIMNAEKNQIEQRVNRTPTFVTLNSGLQQETSRYLAQAVVFPNDEHLPGILMVIKKLWLSDELALTDPDHINEKVSLHAGKDQWTSGIDVRIEFYLRNNTDYYPLYRYDSVISKAMTVSEYAPEFLELALKLSLQKMQLMDGKVAGIVSKTKFTLEDITRHNEKDFDIPALRDTAMNPGVYMTFEEFKNNNPSQTGFEINRDKLTDIISIKQSDGKAYVARSIWGYCNGKNAYVRAGDNFFLLQRRGNAFYIFGAKDMGWEEGSNYGTPVYTGPNSPPAVVYYKSAKWQLQLKPFQLNWSNGKLY